MRRWQHRPGRPVQSLHSRGPRERRRPIPVRCATGGEAPSRPSPTPTWCWAFLRPTGSWAAACRSIATVRTGPSRASGSRSGLGPDETAAGILKINNARAAELIRQQTVVRGYDPRDFVVYAYGGAGPLHAFAFAAGARSQGRRHPAGQRSLHAFGIRLLDVEPGAQHREGAAVLRALRGRRAEQPDRRPGETGARLHGRPGQAERGSGDRALRSHALQRTVAAQPAWCRSPRRAAPTSGPGRGRGRLPVDVRLHCTAMAAVLVSQGVELVTDAHPRGRASASSGAGRGEGVQEAGGRDAARLGTRAIFWPDRMERLESEVFDGREIRHGNRVAGPAVVELPYHDGRRSGSTRCSSATLRQLPAEARPAGRPTS